MLERFGQRLAHSVLMWDIFTTLLCLHLTTYMRYFIEFGRKIPWHGVVIPWQLDVAVIIIWTIAFLLLAPQRAIFRSSLVEAIGRLLAAVALASLVFAGMLYLSFRDISRLQFLYFVGLNFTTLLLVHLIVRSYVSGHQQHRRVLVVGEESMAQQLAHEFERRPWSRLIVVGYTGEEQPTPPTSTVRPPIDEPPSIPRLGAVDETVAVVLTHRIDEVVYAFPSGNHRQIVDLSLQLQQYPVMIHMVPSVLDLTFSRTPVSNLGGIPLISLRESALGESQRMLKRMFDVSASLLLLLLLAPLMLLIAILIKLESPGSIFFLQERIGEHGRRFKMIKFRSMYEDAEQRWNDVAQRDANGHLLHKHEHDPRITPIGRKLRRASLDELPQLFNVLRGEMSLVGPRPEMPRITAEYEPWQWQRFRVPPGMTGWWQINGRSDKPMHLHTEDDLYYIQNYSLWLDLRILYKTIVVVMRGQGAY